MVSPFREGRAFKCQRGHKWVSRSINKVNIKSYCVGTHMSFLSSTSWACSIGSSDRSLSPVHFQWYFCSVRKASLAAPFASFQKRPKLLKCLVLGVLLVALTFERLLESIAGRWLSVQDFAAHLECRATHLPTSSVLPFMCNIHVSCTVKLNALFYFAVLIC